MKNFTMILRAALMVTVIGAVGCRSMQTPAVKSYLDKSKATDVYACLAISKDYLSKVFMDPMDKLNNLETAIDAAEKARTLQPDLPEASYYLGYGMSLKGVVFRDEAKISLGMTYYKNAITKKPAMAGPGYLPPLPFMIAVIKMNSKLNRITDDHAIQLLEEAIKNSPEFAPAHFELSKIYRRQKKYELALQQARVAAELAPNEGVIQKELGLLYGNYIEDRNELVFEAAAKKGIEALKAAVKLNPKDPEIHEALGFYYGVLGMFELKAFEMDTAIGIKPTGSNSFELGNTYLAMGHIDKARTAYLQAVKTDPALTKAKGLSGYCDYLENRFDKACSEFGRYAEDQSLKELNRKLWYYYALWGNGKKPNGDEILSRFSNAFTGNDWERALLDFHLSRIDETQLLSKAKTRFEQCEALYYIGCRYRHEGDKNRAESYFRKALDTRIYSFYEYAGARILLKSLSQGSANQKDEKFLPGKS